jgi:calcium permeable stress-gated cation channel
MVGQIASAGAWLQSILILPLIPFTIWYSYYFKRRFEPLTKYIALGAIRHDSEEAEEIPVPDEVYADEDGPNTTGPRGVLRRRSTLDEFKEMGLTFINPSLVMP